MYWFHTNRPGVSIPATPTVVNYREPPLQPLVLRLVSCPCSLLVAEAEHAIGHEQTNGDENHAGDPECDDDRVVDVTPNSTQSA